MKNILNEKPNMKLSGRLKFSTKFVDDNHIVNKKVLDIGCGFGWFEMYCLKQNVKEVIGIEISDQDLESARNGIKDKRAAFKVGGALILPFKDNTFDTVVAWEVIEHIPKGTENKMFKEVSRVLKKKGVFYLSTPYSSFISTYLDPAYWLIGHRHYSKGKLQQFGKRNGLTVSSIYIKGKWWSLIDLINMYASKWILRRNRLFEKKMEAEVNKEFKQADGFLNIFVKYEKK